MKDPKSTMRGIWSELYADSDNVLFEQLLGELEKLKSSNSQLPLENEWYKNAVVYSLYVDLFAGDFTGLTARLDYFTSLGVSCLWLLPILDSPMKDAGFDIRNYTRIRKDLFGLLESASEDEEMNLFSAFLDEAHKRGIKVIFDIAMNHTSMEHPWFMESAKGKDNPFRDYYIWNKDKELYKETRLLFKGMCPSNWEPYNGEFFFHRFFEFQPDLNYRNPKVLYEMTSVLAFWLSKGVDGFRADAIPYIWKEDGTDCENLPKAHRIIQFFRAATEYLRPNTLILAEACQPPHEVVKYFSDGNECHAGYHFPLMPQIFISLATADPTPIHKVLSESVTPAIPDSCQWFTFLRCHDELTLEMVTPTEREIMNASYRKDMRWNFREGEGISARLANLFDFDAGRIAQAFSIMLTLPGTPIIYYGDEYGKRNDDVYFNQQSEATGYSDTRYYVRGPVDWVEVEAKMQMSDSFERKIFDLLAGMLSVRNQTHVFGEGTIAFIELNDEKGSRSNGLLSYIRKTKMESYLVVHNLNPEPSTFVFNKNMEQMFAYGSQNLSGLYTIAANGFIWLRILNTM